MPSVPPYGSLKSPDLITGWHIPIRPVELVSLQSWVKPLNELKCFCTGCIINLSARATDDVLIHCCVRKIKEKSSES